MLFTRTHRYNFSIPKEHLRSNLVGSKVTIRDLDFEVKELEDYSLCIMPQWDGESSKTLPVTELQLKEDGNKTAMVMTSKMRRVDAGGPMVMMLLCGALFAGSFIFLYISKDPVLTITLCSFSLVIFTMMRMQASYFNYIRHIRSYMKHSGDQITTDVRKQLFKHKLN